MMYNGLLRALEQRELLYTQSRLVGFSLQQEIWLTQSIFALLTHSKIGLEWCKRYDVMSMLKAAKSE